MGHLYLWQEPKVLFVICIETDKLLKTPFHEFSCETDNVCS